MYDVPMSAPTFNTRHSLTGKTQRLTADQISAFPDYLEVVPDDAKPLEPGLFKPGKVGEFEPVAELPQTDTIADLQAQYDALLEDNAPNSKVVRDAKQALDEAVAAYDAEQAEAQQAVEEAAVTGEADATNSEGAE